MADEEATLMDVQARWGYSEIVGSSFYDDPSGNSARIDSLRAKRRSNLPFESLTPDDRYMLALMCASVRQSLMMFMTGIERFREGQLNKTALAALIVPPMVSNIPKFMSFAEYIETPCSEPGDARNVTGGYRPSADPLTLGRLHNGLVLLDGYHRAASFWKFASKDASIAAYVPALMTSSTIRGLGELLAQLACRVPFVALAFGLHPQRRRISDDCRRGT